jgi:hypothetical protein
MLCGTTGVASSILITTMYYYLYSPYAKNILLKIPEYAFRFFKGSKDLMIYLCYPPLMYFFIKL